MNYWAVLLAAASSFVLGGLWYAPRLFGQIWNRENGGQPPAGRPAKVFGVSFAFSLVAAFAFAGLLGPAPRSSKLWLIDAGYHVAQFAVFGLVLGSWH